MFQMIFFFCRNCISFIATLFFHCSYNVLVIFQIFSQIFTIFLINFWHNYEFGKMEIGSSLSQIMLKLDISVVRFFNNHFQSQQCFFFRYRSGVLAFFLFFRIFFTESQLRNFETFLVFCRNYIFEGD